jgi:hypothetical protein
MRARRIAPGDHCPGRAERPAQSAAIGAAQT